MDLSPATPDDGGADRGQGFRLAIVPGAQPQRWVRTWCERLPDVPLELLPIEVSEQGTALSTAADAGLVRLPVDRERFEAIPLYTETTVVVVPKDHLLAAGDELSPGDLADEVLLVPLDDVLGQVPPDGVEQPATTAAAVELVAAGTGVLLVPQSLARLHHRRDLTYRTVTEVPASTIALVWPVGGTSDLVEELIGIVRGRTANSSRGRGAPPPEAPTGGASSSTATSSARPGRAGPGGKARGSQPPARGSGGRRHGGPPRDSGRGRGR